MSSRRQALAIAGALALPLLAIVAPTPARAGGAVIRYASPTGTASADCPVSSPCDLVTAINDASSQAEVVVEPGNYFSADPLNATLGDFGKTLDIHGLAGSSRPVIHSAATVGVQLTNSSLSDVEVDSSASIAVTVLMFYGSADHDVFTASGPNSTACEVNGGLTDSECLTTGFGSRAAEDGLGYGGPAVARPTVAFRGDTLEAVGAESIGLYADSGAYDALTTTVTNSIMHGTQVDIEADTAQMESESTVRVSHSDYATTDLEGVEGGSAIGGDGTDVSTAPKFVAAPGDLAEATGSATIDRGLADPPTDTVDLAGDPRVLGPATDMGAFEFLSKPVVKSVRKSAVTKSSIKLRLTINPEGLTSYTQVLAAHGTKTYKSRLVSVGKGESAKSISQTVSRLHPHTRYRVHVVMVSAGGQTKTVSKVIITKKAPKKKPKKH
jgi:hypothetical protein